MWEEPVLGYFHKAAGLRHGSSVKHTYNQTLCDQELWSVCLDGCGEPYESSLRNSQKPGSLRTCDHPSFFDLTSLKRCQHLNAAETSHLPNPGSKIARTSRLPLTAMDFVTLPLLFRFGVRVPCFLRHRSHLFQT